MNTLAFLALSLLLVALTTHIPPAFAEQVVESADIPVRIGLKYCILPSFVGPVGGGIRISKPWNSSALACPVIVAQDPHETVKGNPVIFTIPKGSMRNPDSIVSTGMPLDVSFAKTPDCVESSRWVVVADDFPRKWIGIGGAKDHPGNKELISGTFMIERIAAGSINDGIYRIMFCPNMITVPHGASSTCVNVMPYKDDIGRRLILATQGDGIFPVRFTECNHTDAIGSSM